MNALTEVMARFGDDKTQHGVGGVMVGAVVFPASMLAGFDVETSGHIAMGVVAAVAIGKEVRDGKGFGTRSWQDAFATISGGALAVYALATLAGAFL